MKNVTIQGYSFNYELEENRATFEGKCLTTKGTINIYQFEGSKPSYEVLYSSFDISSCKNAIAELIDFLISELKND